MPPLDASLATSPTPATQHVAICGAGAFGRNHLRILRELQAAGLPIHLAAPVLTAIVEPDPANAAAAREAGSATGNDAVPIFPSVQALLAARTAGQLRVDAALVCTPTSTHHSIASALLKAGVHVLVEKPIAATLEEADDLIAIARSRNLVLQVGHLERFNPAVQALIPLLRGPMFFEAHRLSVFSPRSLDVDVVLDLMIHDLDIVLQLAQSPVSHVQAVGLPILSAKTDIANVRIEFASGAVANFTASRVSTERVRKLRFFQPHQYISLDYARQDLLVIAVQPPASQSTIPAQLSLESLPTLGMDKPSITPGEPLRHEIESFLQAAATGIEPQVTGEQAREALALALRIQQAIAQHTTHAGLQAFLGR